MQHQREASSRSHAAGRKRSKALQRQCCTATPLFNLANGDLIYEARPRASNLCGLDPSCLHEHL